ncbi:MAG: hypothetical protein HW395_519, partial [candidate division NC10 bacterium]|nr:hypothetical protein [candidate division NC10 bacterium]
EEENDRRVERCRLYVNPPIRYHSGDPNDSHEENKKLGNRDGPYLNGAES